MKISDSVRFGLGCGASALAVGAMLSPAALAGSKPIAVWGSVGWLLASLAGLACGARLVALHGSTGTGFLVTLGACMLGRLIVFAAGAALAAQQGLVESWAYLGGLAAGYFPAQAFELFWFVRKTRG